MYAALYCLAFLRNELYKLDRRDYQPQNYPYHLAITASCPRLALPGYQSLYSTYP